MATQNLGALIDQMVAIRKKKKLIKVKMDAAESEYSAVAKQVLAALEAQETSKAAGTKSKKSAYITSTDQGNIDDWDAFWKYVKRNDRTELIPKRVNAEPYRNLLIERKGKKIPGLSTFTVKRLNLSS